MLDGMAMLIKNHSPECPEGVKEAVEDAFRTCRSTSEGKTRGFTCIVEQFQANPTLSNFVTACPESDNPDAGDRFRCIMRKIGERCPDVGRRPGGPRGFRLGGPRD